MCCKRGQHKLSFKTRYCTSKLVKELFKPNFSVAHTRTEATIVSVISTYIFNEMLSDLKSVNYITVSTDCSNKKDVKLTPTVRYFILHDAVNVKLLYFKEVLSETNDISPYHIFEDIQKYSLESKIFSLCADNNNTNFGVLIGECMECFSKKQQTLERAILGIGCSAHIVHNTVQTACTILLVDVQAITVKLCNFRYQ